MTDLDLIAEAMRAHPDIVGFKRRPADECCPEPSWIIWLHPGWRTIDQGHGKTLEEAYQNARANREADIRSHKMQDAA